MSTLLDYKCPCCGASISFNGELQKMKCEYCDNEYDVETLKACDEELDNTAADNMQWSAAGGEWGAGETDGLRSYLCNRCGASIVADETTGATDCPYCGSPVVMAGQFSGELRPDIVIPFKVTKEEAMAALEKHYKGKKFLPRTFRSRNRIEEIKGIYVPFWLFGCEADADLTYKATNVRRWSDSRYDYKETKHYLIIRKGKIAFDDVPEDGSSKMPDDLMESIEPFDMSKAVSFQTAYLAGYLADKYDVPSEQCVERANQRVRNSTESEFRKTVTGYSTVTPERTSLSLTEGGVKYALMPIWLLNTVYNDKTYTFAMNGQTGKFVGDLPVDKGAFWKWFGILAAAFSAVSFGITLLVSMM